MKIEKTENQNLHEFHSYIVGLVRQINYSFLDLARCLVVVHENKLYEHLCYETFESYIATPEISIRRASAYKLMDIYRTYVLEYKISPARLIDIEWTKLSTTLPVLTEDNVEDLLAMAESLSRSDLRQEIKILKDPSEKDKEELTKTCPYCNGTGKVPIDKD